MASDSGPFRQKRSKTQNKVLDESIPGFPYIVLVGHAREQMKIREVTEDDVVHTLKNPSETNLPTQPDRKRYRWNKTANTAIDVVFDEFGNPKRIRVITVIKVKRRLVERRKR